MQRYAVSRARGANVSGSDILSGLRNGVTVLGLLASVCGAVAPTAGAQTAQFSYAQSTIGSGLLDPQGVAVDSSGDVYIADTSNGRVLKETLSDGNYTQSTIITGLGDPYGVAVDSSGNVYVTETNPPDPDNNQVLKYTLQPGGGYTQSAIGSGLGTLYGVAVDSSGNVYAVDSNNNQVVKETLSGDSYTQSTIGSTLVDPTDVAVDSSGNVYISEIVGSQAGGVVLKETLSGGSYTQSIFYNNYLYDPFGVAVDSSGIVYVSDIYDNRVTWTTGGAEGGAMVGVLNNPFGVAADASGIVYVADTGNNRVVKIEPFAANFNSEPVGSTSAAQALTFTFSIGSTIDAPVVLTGGATGLDFADAGGGSCDTDAANATSLNPGDTCTVNVTFSPKYAGARDGAVNLVNSSGSVIATAYVFGTGVAPQVVFTPSTIGTLGGGFSNPFGVAVDANGDVYVADGNNGVMKEMPAGCSSASCVTTLAGGFTVASDTPFGVAVDGSGNVYFSDGGLYEIPVGCTSAGCVAKMGNNTMAPYGLAVDGGGNVYAADAANNAVWQMPPDCPVGGCTPASLGGGFNKPHGVAVDANGNIYVADTSNNAVKKVPPGCTSSSCVTTLGGGFSDPYGVALDPSGNVYVADSGNGSVKEMPPGCASSSCVTTLASGVDPTGIALDGAGNIYISDQAGNSSVVELNLASPASVSFATTQAGQTSSDSPRTVTVQNAGNAQLNISGVTYATDFPEYSGVDTDCTSTTQVGAGSSCTLSIDFSPLFSSLTSASTSLSESVKLNDNSLNNNAAQQSVGVNGTATAPPATELAFGTPPAASIPVGGNAGSAVTVKEEISGGTVDTWASDTITLTVTYPDNSTQSYTQAAVSGVATFNLSAITLTETGSYSYTASLSGATSAMASELVGSTTIAWSPAPTIIFGSAGTNVLNASVNCVSCGTISYTETPSGGDAPAPITTTAGLNAGSYTITATFTPSTDGFAGTSAMQPLTVSGESVWIVNSNIGGGGAGTAELAGNGYAITSSADAGGTLAAAIDANGNVWSIGTFSPQLESVSQTGIVQHSINGSGGLAAPSAIAIDGASQVWVTNAGNTISLFSNAGTALSPSTGFTDPSFEAPSGIAMDLGGSVWIANRANNTVTRILGAAAPAAPLSTAAKNNTTGARP